MRNCMYGKSGLKTCNLIEYMKLLGIEVSKVKGLLQDGIMTL